jgi:hypothetical protein
MGKAMKGPQELPQNLGEQSVLFRCDLILCLRGNQVKRKTHHKPGMQFDFPPYIPNHLMHWDVQ